MPRQRLTHRRAIHVFPEDFAESLEQIKEASGLSWGELARRLGTSPLTLRRWRAGIRPNAQHLFALMAVARELGVSHLLPTGAPAQPALPGLDTPA
ncbi:MAG: helix-turn-helix transcriptional regulator [Chloroflexi bacterium]|nr:helix-turn-helix transcriptional regulator [Chloroflexota bacterium]